jgi:DAK2 domain fusion protein YloV
MDSNLPAFSTTQQHEVHHKHPIDGQILKLLTEAALTWLRTNQKTVNALNVYPVPDGDTGTNMVLTMQAAYEEIANMAERNAGKIAHAIAHGALMGARGNSGVILSQLWRGFARALDEKEIVDGLILVNAFDEGQKTAYRGVVDPVEGTILTVAKDVAAEAEHALNEHIDDPHEILERVVLAAEQSVQRTPDLLPVLKEAGVVDAGGKGLFYILEGMVRWMNGQPLDTAVGVVQPLAAMNLEDTLETIEPGQDVEVVVDFHPHTDLDPERFYTDLQQIGTSIQIGEGDGIYRLHIHVPEDKEDEPQKYIKSLGDWIKTTKENLNYQIQKIKKLSGNGEENLPPLKPGQVAVVTVAPGSGIAHIFARENVAAIVEGGQTMNPSTQEIINAFKNLPTDKIIILPNNENIILAAEAAAKLVDNKLIKVVPSHSVPEGLAAMLAYQNATLEYKCGENFDEVVNRMTDALDEVETGEITTASRNVEIDGIAVQEGQIIALHNGKLVLAASNLEDACLGLLEKAHADHYELITLFYGAGVTGSEVNHIADVIRSAYPNQTVKDYEGGQPHYQLIISIE